MTEPSFEHAIELVVQPKIGPLRRVATYQNAQACAVAAYRRCRMYSAGSLANADAQYSAVVVDSVPILEFRRVVDERGRTLGVSLDPPSGQALELARKVLTVREIESGQLVIEGPKGEPS